MASKEKVFVGLTSTLQIVLVIALIVFQILSGKTAGLSHHLYYKQHYYLNDLFTTEKTLMMGAAILLISLPIVVMAKKRNLSDRANALSLWAGILILGILLPQTRALLIYPYMVGLLAICWVLSVAQSLVMVRGKGKA